MKPGDDVKYWDTTALRYVSARIASIYDGIAMLLWNDDENKGRTAQVPIEELQEGAR